MHPTLLRTTVLVTAVIAMFAVGCAKKGAVPVTPPPAGNTTTTPINPNSGNTGGTTTNPTTPGGTQGTATVADLKTIFFALDSYSIDGSA